MNRKRRKELITAIGIVVGFALIMVMVGLVA